MSFTNSSTSLKVAKSKTSMNWCTDRENSSSPASSPIGASNQVTASSPCLTISDMHLGDFFFLPEQKYIPDNSCIKHEKRNPAMFGHPVVIVDINNTTGLVSYRCVTSVKKRTDRIAHDINGEDRMATRVCIRRPGYVSKYDEWYNEHQRTESYYLHEDSMDLKKASEVLITTGLVFPIEPETLQRLDWAEGTRVRLDKASAERLAWKCPKVYGPAPSPRRDSPLSDKRSLSSSPSGSPSPPPKRRGVLMERSANITTPSTPAKAARMKELWR